MQDERTVIVRDPAELMLPATRRKFLQALGLGGAVVLMPAVFAACDDNNNITGTAPTTDPQTISLTTDVGVFQFAYVLEQLESAFYENVVSLSTFASLFSAAEQELLADIRNDEVTHRELLRAVVGSTIPNLTFDFTKVAANRPTLLQTSFALEQTGIAAYNGAGKALKNARNLLVAGKIVSVEARHTAAIADALDTTGLAYADLTNSLAVSLGASDANALDAADTTEMKVLANAQPFIVNKITLS